MKVYLEVEDIPAKCINCPFVNSDDACILQDDDANLAVESWDDLKRNCPIVALPVADRHRELFEAEKDKRLVMLPTRNDEIVHAIEEALHIKLYDWQKAYILGASDYLMPGRNTGGTTRGLKALDILDALGLKHLAASQSEGDYKLISPEEYDAKYGEEASI